MLRGGQVDDHTCCSTGPSRNEIDSKLKNLKEVVEVGGVDVFWKRRFGYVLEK